MASPDTPGSEPRPAILVVDDDEDFRRLVVHALHEGPPRLIDEAASAAEARGRLTGRSYDLVITDLSMPGEGGLSLMRWSRQQGPGPEWIVLTGYGTFEKAVEALQLGAYDFLSKPLRTIESLRNSVRNALAHRRLLAERARLHAELEESNAKLREHVDQLERAYELLREQAESVRADLRRAAIIQQALLPRAPPRLGRFQVHALYRPSPNVGGDLYDVVRVDDRNAILLIADAAGHGLSAAMLAVLFRSHLPLVDPDSGAARRPRDALQAANRSLCRGFPAPGLFLTAAYCLLDTRTGRAAIASAGHCPLLLLRSDGGIERVFHSGPALGLYAEADFAQQEIVIEPGDRLLLYSDGFQERFAGEDAAFGEKIASALQMDAEAIPEILRHLVDAPPAPGADGDGGWDDDCTVLLLSASPGPSVLDNALPEPCAPPVEPPLRSSRILRGSAPGRAVLCIQGRPDWAQSAAFHAHCVAAIEGGRGVMIDLTLCPGLDSTFLGTIHDLVERAEAASVELRLQGITPPVERLFEELEMVRVMDHMVPRMLPLPNDMEPLGEEGRDRASQALHLLRVHEGLAALGEANRREFDPLLAALRKEIAEQGSS